jgi:hypothetical protein
MEIANTRRSSMNSLKTLLFTSIVIAFSIISTQQVLAKKPPPPAEYDEKSYRATGCQVHPSDANAVTYQIGGICNNPDLYPPASEVEVVCPVVRDNVLDSDGVLIFVDVGVTSSPIECTAYSWKGPGSLVGTTVDEDTNSAGSFGFSSIFLWLEESEENGSYSLKCILPAPVSEADTACVLSYRVREWEGSADNMTDYDR